MITHKRYVLLVPLMLLASVVVATSASADTGAIEPGFSSSVLAANDDGSTAAVGTGFSVVFAGRSYSKLFVNNNGNLTFGAALSAYTPNRLDGLRAPVIAPFWADVDTRGSSPVTYGRGTVGGHAAFGANWLSVGCYSQNGGVRNSFQVVLISRPDSAPGDFDIEFNYSSIHWESGSASGGDGNCRGGVPARAGYTDGTGRAFEIRESGVPGAFLDGAAGSLAAGTYGSSQPGRFVFSVRNGRPVPAMSAQYVALGDSYASGEGSFSYLAGSDNATDRCHRASDGYAAGLATSLSTVGWDLPACSGAVSDDLYTNNHLYPTEQPQLDRLGKTTELVTLSMGGNDVGFQYVLGACIGGSGAHGGNGCRTRLESPPNGQTSVTTALSWLTNGRPAGCPYYPGFDTQGNLVSTPGCGRIASLSQSYQAILSRAKSATLVVVGYPHLLGAPAGSSCRVGTAAGLLRYTISAADATWLDAQSDRINAVIAGEVSKARAATGRSILFVDPTQTFDDAHAGICDSDPQINGLLFKRNAVFDSAMPFKYESLHPDTRGQDLLEHLLYSSILGVGGFVVARPETSPASGKPTSRPTTS